MKRASRCLSATTTQCSASRRCPTGARFSASDDRRLRLWDLASGECLRVLKGHSGPVNHVAALAGGRALSVSDDRRLRLWDLASGECLRLGGMPARPGGTFRSGHGCRGAARRARPFGRRQDPAALGPCGGQGGRGPLFKIAGDLPRSVRERRGWRLRARRRKSDRLPRWIENRPSWRGGCGLALWVERTRSELAAGTVAPGKFLPYPD